METQKDHGAEDFAQLIARIMATYEVSQSELARRLGVDVSTVNTWVHSKRGGGRGPRVENLRRIAEVFPKITDREVFAAAGRKTPGPLAPDVTEQVVKVFGELTAEQQRSQLIQMKALAEDNRSSAS